MKTALVALACAQVFASASVQLGLHIEHSAVGHLAMLAPAAFKAAAEPGAGATEIACQGGVFIHINASPMLAAMSGGKAPTRAQVTQLMSAMGAGPDLELAENSLDGHPGVLAKTTRISTSATPQWTVIFFCANGLQIEAQGSDALPATKQVCEQIVASVKFDR